MIKQRVIQAIDETGMIAIIRGYSSDEILPIAQALYEGGVRVIEVTCNSSNYLESISRLSKALGDKMWIGAGTVINSIMAQLVIDAGATFVLAPDFNPEVVKIVHEKQRLMIPAVVTPSEMLQAYRMGIDLLKLFPANGLGVDYLKEIMGPLNELAIIPVGGISLHNAAEFAAAGAIAVGVGSELVRKDLIASGEWDKLSEHTAYFMKTFKDGKNKA